MDDLDTLASLSVPAPPPPTAFLRAVRKRRITRRVQLATAIAAPVVAIAAVVFTLFAMRPPAPAPLPIVINHTPAPTPVARHEPTEPTLRALDMANRGLDPSNLKLPTPTAGGLAPQRTTLRDHSVVRDMGF